MYAVVHLRQVIIAKRRLAARLLATKRCRIINY